MKKNLLFIAIPVLAVAFLFGTTAVLANEISTEISTKDNYNEFTSSEIYEVVEFTPPDKTVYTLSEVTTIKWADSTDFSQAVDFDGTGMSMTVMNTSTKKISKYTYSCEYFELDGKQFKCGSNFTFNFESALNVELVPGEYEADVMLMTDDEECVIQPIKFIIINDPETEPPTQASTTTETSSKTDETDSTTQAVPTEEPTEKMVMPELKKDWHKSDASHNANIEILKQDGNKLVLLISSVKNNDADQIAYTQVYVTLHNVYSTEGVIKGEGVFQYTDTFGNEGTGGISVSENEIILVMNKEYSNEGWSVNNATGKYI